MYLIYRFSPSDEKPLSPKYTQKKRTLSHSGAVWGFRSNFPRIPDEDVAVILLCNYEVPGLDMIAKVIS